VFIRTWAGCQMASVASSGVSPQEVLRLPRQHRYDGVFNVRDLGGYPAGEDGRTVRWGVVYRADGIHRLAGGTLDSLRLRTVIDLRSEGERVEHGHFVATDVTSYRHHPVIETLWEPEDYPQEVDGATLLAGRYHEMATIGAAAIIGTLEALTDEDRLPALFHCAAGKDRTGVVAACLLDLLGVCTDDVCADYALSGPVMADLRTWMMRERPDFSERMASHPVAMMDAPPAAMRLLLDVIRGEHGSVEAYLVDRGAPPDLRDRLRDTLLEG
jgi:protein-tyrosine phosphatase